MVDVAALMKRLEGDLELLEDLCEAFPACADSGLEQLRLAVSARDEEGARAAAHSLKGMLLNLAAVEPARCAQEVQEALRRADWHKAEQLLDGLAQAVAEVQRELVDTLQQLRRVP
jgi:HPt (histidine-containing phosphotransfer) domain-containing protein